MTSGVRPWAWIFALVGLGACAVAPSSTAGGPSAASTPVASLAGTRWVGIVEGEADSRILPRLEFAEGGRIMGSTGCNVLGGTWREEGAEVRFGAIAVTKRMCIGPAADIEKRVLAVLGDDSRVSREGARLVITSPRGERFEFAPAAAA